MTAVTSRKLAVPRWSTNASWPLGPASMLLPSGVLLLLTVASTVPMLAWPYPEWIGTSQQLHEQLVFVAPLAAAAATYVAGRLTPPTRIFAQPGSIRAGIATVRRHCSLLAGFFLAAYFLGLLPLFIVTALRAQAGGPHVLTALSGVLGLVAAVCVGYAVGVFAGSAWLAPIVLVAGFVAIQLSAYYPEQLAAIDPVTHVAAGLGAYESTPLTWYRVLFMVLVIVVATVLAARALSRSRRIAWPSGSGACLVALVVVGASVPVIWQPTLLSAEMSPPAVCQRDIGVRFCVHTGHRAQLPALRRVVVTVERVVGPLPSRIRLIQDTALDRVAGPAVTGPGVIGVQFDPSAATNDQMFYAVAQSVAGLDRCPLRAPSSAPTSAELNAADLTAAIVTRAGVTGAGQSSFDGLGRGEFLAWLAEHRRAVDSCALTQQQMP